MEVRSIASENAWHLVL